MHSLSSHKPNCCHTVQTTATGPWEHEKLIVSDVKTPHVIASPINVAIGTEKEIKYSGIILMIPLRKRKNNLKARFLPYCKKNDFHCWQDGIGEVIINKTD